MRGLECAPCFINCAGMGMPRGYKMRAGRASYLMG